MHVTAKFHRPMFNCSEVIVRTNKQRHTDKQTTLLKTSTALRYATPVCNNDNEKQIQPLATVLGDTMSKGICSVVNSSGSKVLVRFRIVECTFI